MNNHLGLNIKNYRKNKGFTQEELAGMIVSGEIIVDSTR